jgi:uncharacterized membrane protein
VEAMSFALGRNARRTTLLLHILCGVGWMGLDLGLATLVLTGATTGSGPVAAASYTAVRIVIPVVVPVLALGMLLTGVVLGLGTKYGLVQWTWVLVKLCVAIVLTVLVFVALVPGALSIPTELTGAADDIRREIGAAASDLIYPPVVSFLALGFAMVVSIWKPWGRTRWGSSNRSR